MKKIIPTLFLLILLVGCRPVEDPRRLASTSPEITIDESGCKPVEVFVPQEEEITVTFNNVTSEDYTWYILFFDNEGAFHPENKENIIAQLPAPANQNTSGSFTAPLTPAKYMTICIPDADPNQVHLINLLVVEPYE